MTKYERFFHNKWRPAIGWIYAVTVFFDFVLAPIGMIAVQAGLMIMGNSGIELTQWEPLTLKGAGLFHISMLTIVGVTAYGRTKEKLKDAAPDMKLPELLTED